MGHPSICLTGLGFRDLQRRRSYAMPGGHREDDIIPARRAESRFIPSGILPKDKPNLQSRLGEQIGISWYVFTVSTSIRAGADGESRPCGVAVAD
jgi:hypothetical protein